MGRWMPRDNLAFVRGPCCSAPRTCLCSSSQSNLAGWNLLSLRLRFFSLSGQAAFLFIKASRVCFIYLISKSKEKKVSKVEEISEQDPNRRVRDPGYLLAGWLPIELDDDEEEGGTFPKTLFSQSLTSNRPPLRCQNAALCLACL